MADKNFRVKNGLETPLIASDAGTTALTLTGANVAVSGDLTVSGNDIKSSSATAITMSGADVTVAGNLSVSGSALYAPQAVISGAFDLVPDDIPGVLTLGASTPTIVIGQVGGSSLTSQTKLNVGGNVEIQFGNSLLLDGSTSGAVGLKAPAVAGSTTYTLPSADGSSGQVLSTNGSGTLSWATASGGGGSTLPISNSGTNSTHPWSLGPGVLLTSSGTTGTMPVQSLRYQPIYVSEACTLTEVAISVSGTAPTGCSVMIYIDNCSPNSATEWQPTSHLSGGYCGEISITSTGLKTITGLNISLAPGSYLIVIQSNNFTVTALTLGHYGGQVLTSNGYTINATTPTTSYAWGRTGQTYVSGTPAAVTNFINLTSPSVPGLPYTVFTKFAKV